MVLYGNGYGYTGFTIAKHRLQNAVFCADSGTSRCTLFAYVLQAVGKKTWEKRRKTGSFQCENERKTFAFLIGR
jgi:hypothetical protein